MLKLDYNVVLGSQSPRRQELLKGLDIPFSIRTTDIEETFPEELQREEIPVYLAELKSNAIPIEDKELLITSDTIVWINNHQLGKPSGRDEAFRMLEELSGKTHEVITGVTIRSKNKMVSFYDVTKVYFNELDSDTINYYLDNYKPYDKAGSYGIQEWIGYVGINQIEGCYFNVMGLPLNRLNKELNIF